MPTKVFVTGASGFIAKHIVLQLLQAGHQVVGSVRSAERADEVRDAVRPHLPEDFDLDAALEFWALDLSRDEGWAEALAGCKALIHTASPFPQTQPKAEEELIRPAVDGTLRALQAAHDAGIERVVLTSSAVAVIQRHPPKGRIFDETDWSEPDHPTNSPYGRSKLMAERAAWDFIADKKIALTTINPVLVLGRPLDDKFGTSVAIVRRLLRGTDRMLPKIGVPIVDVQDVAKMHVACLENPDTHGMRILATAGFLWYHQIAETLAEAYPDRQIATRIAPNFLIKLAARFNSQLKEVLPLLDLAPSVSNSRARTVLGIQFTPTRDAVRATGAYLLEHDKL